MQIRAPARVITVARTAALTTQKRFSLSSSSVSFSVGFCCCCCCCWTLRHLQSLYANVVPPKSALRSFSISSEYQNTRKPPSLRPRSSHPRSSVNMNDTYAVVNKFKQPSTAPPLVPHHYDNENLNSQKTSANDLYSIVKPKNRPVANTPASTVPAHDRTWQLNHRPPEHTDYSGYESLPAEFQMRDSKAYPSLPQVPSNRHSHSDDDYEYVSNPIRENSRSQGSTGGIGFKCRVKKPKGPRDPPSQWNRPER